MGNDDSDEPDQPGNRNNRCGPQSGGENNDDAVWGTSEKVTLRSHVSIGPDGPSGPWHLVLQQKVPNTGGGMENRTSGIGHWYSFDKGFTWTADIRNPLVTWDLMEFPDNGQANKFNSTHLLFDPPRKVGHLIFWGNDTPQGMNSPGTKLYALTFPLESSPSLGLPGMNTERGKQALKRYYAA